MKITRLLLENYGPFSAYDIRFPRERGRREKGILGRYFGRRRPGTGRTCTPVCRLGLKISPLTGGRLVGQERKESWGPIVRMALGSGYRMVRRPGQGENAH